MKKKFEFKIDFTTIPTRLVVGKARKCGMSAIAEKRDLDE